MRTVHVEGPEGESLELQYDVSVTMHHVLTTTTSCLCTQGRHQYSPLC